MTEFPRRINIDRLTPAERAIRAAMQEVERVGADERLTTALILLEHAGNLVADFVDGVPPRGEAVP